MEALDELGPPEGPEWGMDEAGVAHRDLKAGGATVHFAIADARSRRNCILALDEAIGLRPEADEPLSELSAWEPVEPEGQRRLVPSLGLTLTMPTGVDEDMLLTVDAIVALAEDLLAQRVHNVLGGYRARRGGWQMCSLARRAGGVSRPQLLDAEHLSEAIVRRGRADAVIHEVGP